MSDNTFAVVFTGQLVEGTTPDQVKANFAQLFKVEVAKVAPMFTGKPVAIKKGLDEGTARKYQQALRQAGAVCQVVDLAAAKPAVPPPAQAPARPVAEPSGAGTTPPVVPLQASLAKPGVLLIEPEQVRPLQVDTSRLSLGAVGETLVEPEPVTELRVDISALSMAEPGAVLQESEAVAPLQVDITGLTLA